MLCKEENGTCDSAIVHGFISENIGGSFAKFPDEGVWMNIGRRI